jgi:hypothetical protein
MQPKVDNETKNKKSKSGYIKKLDHQLDILFCCPKCERVWTQWWEGILCWEDYPALKHCGSYRKKICPECSGSGKHIKRRS